MHTRRVVLSGLVALTATGVTACGGSGDGSEIVVQVTGVGAITKAALDHWTRVEAVLLHEEYTVHPPPKGIIPDPPSYKDCIAYLRRTLLQEKASVPTSATLKHLCKEKESNIRTTILGTMIRWYWVIGRAQALGIRPSDAEVRQQLTKVVSTHTVYGSSLTRDLELTGQTMADVLLRSRVQLLEVEIEHRLRARLAHIPADQRQTAYAAIAREAFSSKEWIAKTSCRSGYVIPECRQYAGPRNAIARAN
jgi:hypothetical protein